MTHLNEKSLRKIFLVHFDGIYERCIVENGKWEYF